MGKPHQLNGRNSLVTIDSGFLEVKGPPGNQTMAMGAPKASSKKQKLPKGHTLHQMVKQSFRVGSGVGQPT